MLILKIGEIINSDNNNKLPFIVLNDEKIRRIKRGNVYNIFPTVFDMLEYKSKNQDSLITR